SDAIGADERTRVRTVAGTARAALSAAGRIAAGVAIGAGARTAVERGAARAAERHARLRDAVVALRPDRALSAEDLHVVASEHVGRRVDPQASARRAVHRGGEVGALDGEAVEGGRLGQAIGDDGAIFRGRDFDDVGAGAAGGEIGRVAAVQVDAARER